MPINTGYDLQLLCEVNMIKNKETELSVTETMSGLNLKTLPKQLFINNAFVDSESSEK